MFITFVLVPRMLNFRDLKKMKIKSNQEAAESEVLFYSNKVNNQG